MRIALSLRNRLALILLGTIGTLLLIQTVFSIAILRRSLNSEILKRAESLGRSTTSEIVNHILTRDHLSLATDLDRTIHAEPNIAYLAVISEEGLVLAHTFPAFFPADLLMLQSSYPKDRTSSTLLDTGSGMVRDVSVPISGGRLGWVRVGISSEALALSSERMVELSVVLALVLGTLSLLASYLFVRRITRPVTELAEVARNFGEGNLWARSESGARDEMGILSRAFNAMLDDLAADQESLEEQARELEEEIAIRRSAEENLRANEERYKLLFNSTNDMILLYTAGGSGKGRRIEEINESASRILGYSREDVIGWDVERLLTRNMNHPRGYPAPPAISGGTPFPGTAQCREGAGVPVEVSTRRFMLEDAEMELAVMRDISERLRIEEFLTESIRQKETFLREIHHRVKNNLQVISGLLEVQGNFLSAPEMRKPFLESIRRIRTISLIHELLYRGQEFSRLDMKEYLEPLCRGLLQTCAVKGIRVDLSLSVDSCEEKLDTLIPCGIIVSELVSNAFKHAFVGRSTGRLEITLRHREGTYDLTVRDNGKGLPECLDPASTSSMGLKLVTLLVQQLGGTLRIGREGGATFLIRFSSYREAENLLVW